MRSESFCCDSSKVLLLCHSLIIIIIQSIFLFYLFFSDLIDLKQTYNIQKSVEFVKLVLGGGLMCINKFIFLLFAKNIQ